MRQPQACILGGTGFVGRHLLLRLTKAGWHCRIPTRYPHRHRDLALYHGVSLMPVPTIDADGLAECLDNADLVVNLIGILNEAKDGDFQRIHVELVGEVVTAALAAGVPRYLHMSALHADAQNGRSAYLRSNGAGEDLAHSAAGLDVTSFRPSVVFGRGDSFFNRFATLLVMAPGLFPLACPDARFAPVWVGDLTEAMVHHQQRHQHWTPLRPLRPPHLHAGGAGCLYRREDRPADVTDGTERLRLPSAGAGLRAFAGQAIHDGQLPVHANPEHLYRAQRLARARHPSDGYRHRRTHLPRGCRLTTGLAG